MANANRNSKAVASTGAPSKVSNEKFEIGQHVILNNGSTDNKDVEAIVEKYAAGWYVLRLVATGKMQSARAGSLTAQRTAPASDSDEIGDDEDFFQTNRAPAGTDLPYEPDEEADEADELEEAAENMVSAAQRMAEALRKARTRYQKTRRPEGAASADCGDKIAKELREYEPLEVARLADFALKVTEGTHAAKYANLNNGQIRMNSGNRIRAYYKKTAEEAAKGDEAANKELARLNKLLNLVEEDDESEGEDAE